MNHDNDQHDRALAWIKQHTNTILLCVFVLFSSLGLNEYYTHYQQQKRIELTDIYTDWKRAISDKNFALAKKRADDMQVKYPSHTLTHLVMSVDAKMDFKAGKALQAKETYAKILSHCKAPYCDMFQFRLARIHFIENDLEKAKETLDKIDNNLYIHLKNMLLGDIYLREGKVAEAKQLWLNAYNDIDLDKNPQKIGLKSQLTYRLQKLYESKLQKDSTNRQT